MHQYQLSLFKTRFVKTVETSISKFLLNHNIAFFSYIFMQHLKFRNKPINIFPESLNSAKLHPVFSLILLEHKATNA